MEIWLYSTRTLHPEAISFAACPEHWCDLVEPTAPNSKVRRWGKMKASNTRRFLFSTQFSFENTHPEVDMNFPWLTGFSPRQ